MAEALLQYQEALDQCNALNAAEPVDEAEPSAFDKVRQGIGEFEFKAPDLSNLNPFSKTQPE